MPRGPLGQDQFLLSGSRSLGALEQQRGEPPPPVPVPRPGTSEAWSVSPVTDEGLPLACACWDRGQGRRRPRRTRQLRRPERPSGLPSASPSPGAVMCAPRTCTQSWGTLASVPTPPWVCTHPRRSPSRQAGEGHKAVGCGLGGEGSSEPTPPTWPTFCAQEAGDGGPVCIGPASAVAAHSHPSPVPTHYRIYLDLLPLN